MTATTPPVEIFLARHGQSEWNLAGRRQGQLDSPLTETGEAQARRLAELLDGLGIDAVLSSPLGRARTTARIVADVFGLSVPVLDDLAELHHGEYAGLTSAELAERAGWLARATNKYDWRFPGGESYRDADARAAQVIGYVMRLGAKRPLLISHEMIGRMLIKNLLGTTPEEALAVDQPHGVVYRYEVGRRSLTALGITLDGGLVNARSE